MREWNLKAGDPLALTLAADARLGPTNYYDDQIWELKLGGGDPPALALQTTYGLRARSMRLFPRFEEGDRAVTDPAEFASPPTVRAFFPNYLRVQCTPFDGLDVELEYWVPQSQAAAGRIRLRNGNPSPRNLRLSWIAQLTPTDGQRMAPEELSNAPLLAGQTVGLTPVVFFTGGPQAVSSPYPALNLEIELPSGASRLFTWCHAALAEVEASFALARQVASRSWEAEIARVELLNAAQVEIYTGDPDWDATFAFSQKLAYAALIGPTNHLPAASIVLSRQPDQGYSLRGDGSDYNHLWNGQSPLEIYYLAGLLLPGAATWLQGLLRNTLVTRQEDGSLDWKPGLAGQRSHLQATPLLASLAWRIYQVSQDRAFLAEVFQPLLDFVHAWFSPRHDRDADGMPEWDHPMQAGFEDHPVFSLWHVGSLGVDISTAETPTLGAMLYRECQALIHMAGELDRLDELPGLESLAHHLAVVVEAAWDESNHTYFYVDRDSHTSTVGERLSESAGPGEILVQRTFDPPVRLFVQVRTAGETTRHPELFIYGDSAKGQHRVEHISYDQFRWFSGRGTLTGDRVYARIERIVVKGVDQGDIITLSSVGYECADQTLLLPLWAGTSDPKRARALLKKTITAKRRYWRPFGIPACPGRSKNMEDPVCSSVHLPWSALIGEGMLAYGFREEAAELISRLMAGIIRNLKQSGAFWRHYQVETGDGLGERNTLDGLAPLGLFLETLGVRLYSAKQVFLTGFNPFPWPVTVKYQGLTILRRKDSTVVTFPDGQTTTLLDPSPQVVSLA